LLRDDNVSAFCSHDNVAGPPARLGRQRPIGSLPSVGFSLTPQLFYRSDGWRIHSLVCVRLVGAAAEGWV
jgi:hypothetical protein